MYLQLRMKWKGSKLLRHFLQFLCLLMAWFTAMTRVSNYKHHWSDVLAGSTLGTVSALVVVSRSYHSTFRKCHMYQLQEINAYKIYDYIFYIIIYFFIFFIIFIIFYIIFIIFYNITYKI